MSKTRKHEYTTKLFKSGTSNSHKSLKKEFRGLNGIALTGPSRGLIDRRDYESDRMKGWRHAVSHARRAEQKRISAKEIAEQIKEYDGEPEFEITYVDYPEKLI